MTQHLHLWREAAHRAIEDGTTAGEASGRVNPLLVVLHSVEAVPVRRDDGGMDVDLTPIPVDELEALWPMAARELVSQLSQDIDDTP